MALWAAGMMTLGLTPSPHLPLRAAAHGGRGATPRLAVREVVVVGGGWAGYAAADALSASGDCHVTLLEASPRAAGGLAGGWRTPGGRPVEAGIHGFWRYYTNTLAVLDSIGLDADAVLTPYTPSVLVSKSGRVATAPVLAVSTEASTASSSSSGPGFPLPPLSLEAALKRVADTLPAPLDTALLADFAPGSRLTLADRASALGLLAYWADFRQEDPESWARYDAISAEELFKGRGGVSDGLYEELVQPLLHVLPMAPGYDVSAAAALSCFHVFALQARGAFDVRWCRGGISELIFAPWQAKLEARGNVCLRGGARVGEISRAEASEDGDVNIKAQAGLLQVSLVGDEAETLTADAVILAVGGTAAARLAEASPVMRGLPACQGFDELRGVTCVAVRLFLKPSARRTAGLMGGAHDATLLPPEVAEAMRASPVVVAGPEVGGIPELAEAGFCIYDLQRMHDEHANGELGVLEVDFYRADDLAELEDDAVVALALRAAAAALEISPSVLVPSMVEDRAIVRARRAVSHFAVGSAALSPGVRLGGNGLYACGDWVDRTGHASWSTEKAVVTGRQAAAAVAADFKLSGVDSAVLPAEADTAPLAALRTLAGGARAAALGADALPPPAPWAALRAMLPKP